MMNKGCKHCVFQGHENYGHSWRYCCTHKSNVKIIHNWDTDIIIHKKKIHKLNKKRDCQNFKEPTK